MTYTVAGANVFGQWLTEDHLYPNFHKVSLSEANLKLNFSRIRLVDVNWAYNIFQIDNDYYVSGSWHGQENQFIKADFPEECKNANEADIIMAGNDYELIFVSKKMRMVWVMDLEKEEEIKKFNFTSDIPPEPEPENVVKRLRKDDVIVKIVTNNNTYLFMSSEGNVYSGVPPVQLDTRHCVGKVCDIQSGYEHCVLLTDQGRVYTWGNGRRLQLGHGDISNLESPAELEALAGIEIIKISAGGWHSLALSEFGDLYVWGWNDTGQLGIKSQSCKSYSVPTLVDFFDENGEEVTLNVKDIACGSKHSAVLLEDGTIWTTGFNKYAQLGFPSEAEPAVNCFKKSYQCSKNIKLKCGPWSTIIINK